MPVARSGVLTFDLKGKDRDAALVRLEVASTRLFSHLPFMGAFVSPCTDRDGSGSAFRVHSASNDTVPLFQLQEHAPSTPLLVNGDLNPEFLPSPEPVRPSHPCPVLRIKANVVGDALYLILPTHHTVLDGLGSLVVCKILAQLCRDPYTPAKGLPTSAAEQEEMRAHIAKLGASSTPQPLRWDSSLPHLSPLNPKEYRNMTLNRLYGFRAERVRQIQQACQVILDENALDTGKKVRLSTSLIVSALLAICCDRAQRAAGLGEICRPSFSVCLNIRRQLNVLPTYMGNAVVRVNCPQDPRILGPTKANPTYFVSGLAADDVHQICNIALSLSQEIQAYTPDHVAGMMGTLHASENWSSAVPPFDGLRFTDMHKMDFYDDYGPLGELQDFVVAGNKTAGVAWMLPTKPPPSGSKRSGHYELLIALERAAIEELEKDQLFQWVTATGPSKTKL